MALAPPAGQSYKGPSCTVGIFAAKQFVHRVGELQFSLSQIQNNSYTVHLFIFLSKQVALFESLNKKNIVFSSYWFGKLQALLNHSPVLTSAH